MCNKENKNACEKGVSQAESAVAYREAQLQLQEIGKGYVPYDRIFTKRKEAKHAFKKLVSGELMEFIGCCFYWKRSSEEPLILYAENTVLRQYKSKGLVELCRIRVPEVWIGAGRFRVDWPETGEKKESDPTPILISLYLYSTDPEKFKDFVANTKGTFYLASLYFEGENAALLDDLAEERFMSLV